MFTSIDVNNFRFHLSVLRNIQLKEMFCPTEIPTQMGVVNPSIWICCSCYVFGHQFGFFFFAKRTKKRVLVPRTPRLLFLFLVIHSLLYYFRLFADLFFSKFFQRN